jgi:hypothetical protein
VFWISAIAVGACWVELGRGRGEAMTEAEASEVRLGTQVWVRLLGATG